ncbi:hypothetical protein RIF29_21492 [Crotalaria pallida]|uniref:RNase H type-1 domain-containing protein n=1 Tax=Crotalaria pallida TaxID=3830 RepID=A0AAN9F7F6_CROPI
MSGSKGEDVVNTGRKIILTDESTGPVKRADHADGDIRTHVPCKDTFVGQGTDGSLLKEVMVSLSKCNMVHDVEAGDEVQSVKAKDAIDNVIAGNPNMNRALVLTDEREKSLLSLSPSHLSFSVGKSPDKKKTWKRRARVASACGVSTPCDNQKRKQGVADGKGRSDGVAGTGSSNKRLACDSTAEFTGIYGFPTHSQKAMTRQLVQHLRVDPDRAWLVMGDWNQILRPEDKQGGCGADLHEMDELNSCLAVCGLKEVKFIGYRYTWSNKRNLDELVEEWLDYAVANKVWDDIWGDALVTSCPRYQSDHNPICLETCKKGGGGFQRKKKKLYRFEQFWLEEFDECRGVIYHSWYHGGDIMSKLENVGSNLRDWSKDKFGCLHKKITVARDKLLKIPLTEIYQPDSLLWPLSKDGNYTVRSAYHFIMNPNGMNPSTSTGSIVRTNWKKLWSVPVIPRVKEMVWRAVKNILPTNKRLVERGLNLDPICPQCGMEEESITHVLLHCEEAKRLCILENPRPDSASGSSVSWKFECPESECECFLFDAAHKSDIGSGFGCVAIDHDGSFLLAATRVEPALLEPRIAEAAAMRWCLNLIEAVGITHVNMVTDCLELVQAWQRGGRYNTYFDALTRDCAALRSNFISLNVMYKHRSDNAIADFLANYAFDVGEQMWVDFMPTVIEPLFNPPDVLSGVGAPS